jgi:hypothetical protein
MDEPKNFYGWPRTQAPAAASSYESPFKDGRVSTDAGLPLYPGTPWNSDLKREPFRERPLDSDIYTDPLGS